MELGISITSMPDVVSFIGFPSQSEGFSFGNAPRLFIETMHIVAIRGWFFFGVSKYDCGYGSLVAFSEGTAFVGDGVGDLWLDDVGIIYGVVLEATIPREAVFMGSVAPGADGLVPLGVFFGHGDVGITQED